MKKLKGFGVLFASIVLAIALIPMFGEKKVKAKPNHTKSEAVSWITARENEGWAVDYDGAYGPQCVDLIVYYWEWLTGSRTNGNAYAYADKNLPSGWIYTSSPQPGDIAVWRANKGIAGSYGHVALVKSVSGSNFYYVDVNGATGKAGHGSISITNPSTFIHPDFDDFANLGEDFYATILSTDYWKPISKVTDSNKIYLKNEDGSSRNLWRFTRQSDGAYVISSCYDGKVLEMTDGIQEINHQIEAKDEFWGGAYQQWYLIPQGDGYIFLSKHYTSVGWVMDNYCNQNIDGNAINICARYNNAAQTWSVYQGDDVQLKGPELKATVGTAGEVSFSWTGTYGASNYNVRIFKDELWEGEDFTNWKIMDRTLKVKLDPGTYYAYVDAANYHTYQMGNVVTFTVPPYNPNPIKITSNPSNATVYTGTTASFSVAATGNGLTYQWQYKNSDSSTWNDYSGMTSATLNVPYLASRNGMSFRCKIKDSYGDIVYSNAAVLKYKNNLVITSNPTDVTVITGNTAKFIVSATGDGVTYQWQYKSAGSSDWYNYSGMTSATLSVPYLESRNGMSFRCKVSDTYGNTAWSNAALLTYKTPITITSQPSNLTAIAGELAYFNVKATGNNLTYLWQYKEAGASSWTDWTTKTTAVISVAYAASRNGMSLRCVIADAEGNKAYSNAAVLTYKSVVKITAQPENTTVKSGELAYFEVKATGSGLKYLWQYKEKGKSSWTDWTTKTTAKISVAYAASRNGMSLRCVITDSEGNKATSDEAVLTYKAASNLAITAQPENTIVNSGELAYFEVKATGNGLKYLWQYKEAGKSSWTDWTTKTTASISVAYAASRNGMSLRCVITDNTGNKVTSNAATLTYKSNNTLAITKHPSNASVNDGEMAYFEVTATGSGLKYLWQYKEVGKSWTDWTSKTTAKISVAYAAYRNGMSLRCVVTDSTGKQVTSNTVTLTYKVNNTLAITTQPKNTSVSNNSIAYFSVKATGVGLKYQWQYKNASESSWTTWSSKTTADISVAYAAYRNGMSLRCVITDSKGNVVVSDTAVLSYK